MFAQLYQNRVLKNPKTVFVLLIIAILSFGIIPKILDWMPHLKPY